MYTNILHPLHIILQIQQWHEHLRPILAKSRERHHFDVFQLGTEIIDTIQTSSNNTKEEGPNLNSTTFDDIMDQKDKSYVSRYFLSTLLLVNQSNVNIVVENKSSEHPSSWPDIKLKLLSTKRHTVAIEDNIGLIDDKKRKQTLTPTDDNTRKKKIKTAKTTTNAIKEAVDVNGEDEDINDDDDEPLVNLQTTSSRSVKRPAISEVTNVKEKKFKGIIPVSTSTPKAPPTNSKEFLILSQQILPPVSRFMDMPTTSQQAKEIAATQEVNLNNMRVMLQPIEKVPRQSDDYDSGIFSLGEMSTVSL